MFLVVRANLIDAKSAADGGEVVVQRQGADALPAAVDAVVLPDEIAARGVEPQLRANLIARPGEKVVLAPVGRKRCLAKTVKAHRQRQPEIKDATKLTRHGHNFTQFRNYTISCPRNSWTCSRFRLFHGKTAAY